MTTPSFRHIVVALWLLAARSLDAQSTEIVVAGHGAQTEVALSWAADPGTFYEIWSATNLAVGPWTLAVEDPVNATNLVGQMQILSADRTRFFQVRLLDTQGPAITARYPASGDSNVGLAAALSVGVSDPSGIDTNTFRFSIDGGAPLPLDAAGIGVSPDGFSFDPALAATTWGGHGATVTVSFACADLKGNATVSEWAFYLEVPLVVAENILVLGSTPALSYAVVPSLPLQGGSVARLAAIQQPLDSGLAIVAIYPDRIVCSYTGDAHGIAMGALLANNDYDNIFYRRVTGLADNPAAKQVTVYTEDVPFTHLITDGSFNSAAFTMVGGEGLTTLDVMPLAGFEMVKRYSASGTYNVSRNWGAVTFSGSAGYTLTGGMDFSTQIEWMKLKNLTAGVYAELGLSLSGSAVFDAATEPVDKSLPLLGGSLLLVRAKGVIYGIPVVVSLWLDLDLCVEAESAGSVTLSAGAAAGASFTNRIAFSEGVWTREPERDAVRFTYTLQPVSLSGGMEGQAYLYLKPKLTLRLYEAVGVGLDYRRGPLVTGSFSAAQGQFQFALYDSRSVNLSLWVTELPNVLKGVIDPDDLPEWNLWTAPDDLKRTWYWPEVPLSAPAFTLHPSGGTFASGAAVALTASASGNPAPTYQWCQNGSSLIGRTGQTLAFTMGASAAGSYHCRASNNRGTAISQSASVSLPASTPAGMALIPAGSFQMGDSFTEGLTFERPVHSVYVSAFYMDRYEVTWAKWQEVRTWAAANGYDIGSVGLGKASSHPVHSVNWYDCVKWLNARSQMEGKTACYTVSGATYKTGFSAPTCNWSANGYRLPTEAEWEKAARGGVGGRRFPWGDTINHSRANYRANGSAYTYDTSPYTSYTYHPDYDNAPTPYTSPVGSFAPNGYGLYDMSGNLWEWCWDWYGSTFYGSSPASDPRGASSGSYRVFRGGCLYYDADSCRVAYRSLSHPEYRNPGNSGFRAVLPPGQQ